MRTNSRTLKSLHNDLDLLGFRRRRIQDLRHTMISLSRTDGARTEILKRVTHQPPTTVIEGYTHWERDVVCTEVMKLRLDLIPPVPSPEAPERAPVVSDEYVEPETAFATVLATDALRQNKTPENLSALGGFPLRGVGDLNP